LIYGSQFRHLVIAGRTRDGREFALAAGQHEPDYPYPEAGFDAVILKVGDRLLQRASRQLSGLELPMLQPHEERELAMALELRAAAKEPHDTPGRELVLVECSLPLRLGAAHVTQLGPQKWVGDWFGMVPGMRYAVMVMDVSQRNAPWIRLDGQEVALDPLTLTGQIEWGDLANWSCRSCVFGYRYRCAVEPSGDRVRVDLRTYSLYADGWMSRTADLIADATASVDLVGGRHRGAPPPPPDVAPRADALKLVRVERLVSAPLRLGPADVDRALCRFRDGDGRELIGIEESFRPASGAGYPPPEEAA
jgi:hypothetical protein